MSQGNFIVVKKYILLYQPLMKYFTERISWQSQNYQLHKDEHEDYEGNREEKHP